MSFPFNLGQPYVYGAGYVMCTDWHFDLTIEGERKQTFTIEAYGDVFYDASQPPTTGPAAPPAPEPMPRRFIRDETGRVMAEAFIEERIRPAQFTYANGQFTPIPPPANPFLAPPAARTPACLVDALCRRGRFIQTPPPRETGA